MGFQPICVFLLMKEKERQTKMITGISGFVLFSRNGRFRDAHLFFKKCFAGTPFLKCFLGCAFFGQVVKKGKY